jgi:hypothetical protein
MPQLVGLQRHAPPPLLLVQPAEQQIHLVMKQLVGVIPRLTTIGTLTLMDFRFLHDSPPQSMRWNWGKSYKIIQNR